MPKLKSNRGAAKRFRATKNGFKRKAAFRNHMMTCKTHKNKRHLRSSAMVAEVDQLSVERMLPYHK